MRGWWPVWLLLGLWLFLTIMAALSGCAAGKPYYSGTTEQHLIPIPCDYNNCGKEASE